MVEQIMKVYGFYCISTETLFIALELLNRYFRYISQRLNFNQLSIENLMEFKISAMIILNLASKYFDRVAFNLTDLISRVVESLQSEPSSFTLRMYEFEILRAIDFKVRSSECCLYDQLMSAFEKLTMESEIDEKVKA
jgi:hypothetical protein